MRTKTITPAPSSKTTNTDNNIDKIPSIKTYKETVLSLEPGGGDG